MGYGEDRPGVARLLGIDDVASGVLAVAARRWPDWADRDDRLRVVPDLTGLRAWLRASNATESDPLLLALAERGTVPAVGGGDDRVAASVLAFAVLPGASTMARRLSRLAPNIDELVAAQLWIEVRTFPWQRLGKVAANILMDTRAAVLRECEVASQLLKHDRTLYDTLPVDPADAFWCGPAMATPARPEPTAAEELLELLEWACATEVITTNDRALLLALAQAADQADVRRNHGRAGLLTNDITEMVAREYGVTALTVRRRASRSITALSRASASREISA